MIFKNLIFRKKKKEIEVESDEGDNAKNNAKFHISDLLMCDQSELFLSSDDIEKLNDRYEELYKKIRNSENNISEKQKLLEQQVLLEKYAFEIAELSKERECEYYEAQAKIMAKNGYVMPFRHTRFLFLRRLFRRPTQNRAQDIIDDEAALNADDYFKRREEEIARREMLKMGRVMEITDEEEPTQAEEPSAEPKRRKRRRKSEHADVKEAPEQIDGQIDMKEIIENE